jgi:hypothetical protein
VNQPDGIFRMYAKAGLRTIDDWTTLGRGIQSGAEPRLHTPHHGEFVPLFSRAQTRPQTQSPLKRHEH